MAELPPASPAVRAELDARARAQGWPALHAELARVDRAAAARIQPADAQRIQRALEVHRLTGRPISEWQAATRAPAGDGGFLRFALVPRDRRGAAARGSRRASMPCSRPGSLAEVAALQRAADLHADLPAMRAVGYRQLWAALCRAIEPRDRRASAHNSYLAACQAANDVVALRNRIRGAGSGRRIRLLAPARGLARGRRTSRTP